jgi:hypothetical protein
LFLKSATLDLFLFVSVEVSSFLYRYAKFWSMLIAAVFDICCLYNSSSWELQDLYTYFQPIPVAVRSKAWVCVRSLAGIVGLNDAGGMDVCLLRVIVFSGRALCVGLITRPEESYRVWCVRVIVKPREKRSSRKQGCSTAGRRRIYFQPKH